MEDLKTKAGKISSQAKDYIDTLFKLTSAKITQKIVQNGSLFIAGLILVFFIVLAIIFLSLGLGFWLGDLLNNRMYGFLLVGGFYFFLFCILLLLRRKTLLPLIRNIIVRMLYD
jgi:hypothetical protein